MDWQKPPAGFAKLLMQLGAAPQERTVYELFEAFELPADKPFLTRLTQVSDILEACGVETRPRLQDGESAQRYLLRKSARSMPSELSLRERIRDLENAAQEFKTTYWCDFKRRANQPNATSIALRSNDVRDAALKAIAGFLTTGGGTLFIGIADNGDLIGLDPDLEILDPCNQTVDRLINMVKSDISALFYEGDSVNDYVEIAAVRIDGAQILKFDVAARQKLSFLRSTKQDHYLYRRQENRTTKVQVFAIEEFIEWRKSHLSSQS